jgi:hypothetical protein
MLVDAQDAGARSCGVTFMQRGDYPRAFDYLHLDSDSDVSKAVSIDVLLRQGKQSDARQAMLASVPQWGGYSILLAYLQHRPAEEIAAMTRKLQRVAARKTGDSPCVSIQRSGAITILRRTQIRGS